MTVVFGENKHVGAMVFGYGLRLTSGPIFAAARIQHQSVSSLRVLQFSSAHLIIGSYVEALAQLHNEVRRDVNFSERHHVNAAALCNGSERQG